MSAYRFIEDHGIAQSQQIINDAPEGTEMFVYAYVPKTTYYLKNDGLEWRVFHADTWRVVACFLQRSFANQTINLSALRDAVEQYEKSNAVQICQGCETSLSGAENA